MHYRNNLNNEITEQDIGANAAVCKQQRCGKGILLGFPVSLKGNGWMKGKWMDGSDDLGPGLLVCVSAPAWSPKSLLISPLPDSPAPGLIPSQADKAKPHTHPASIS